MEPIRINICAVACVRDGMSVDSMADDVDAALSWITGLHVQTISTSAMDLSEVVPGSPLARDLYSTVVEHE